MYDTCKHVLTTVMALGHPFSRVFTVLSKTACPSHKTAIGRCRTKRYTACIQAPYDGDVCFVNEDQAQYRTILQSPIHTQKNTLPYSL